MKAKVLILTLMVVAFFIGPTAGASDDGGVLEVQFPQTGLMVPGVSTVVSMTADLNAMNDSMRADGNVVYHAWYDADNAYIQTFRSDVVVTVPNKALQFATIAEAMDADVRMRFSHHGQAYAECMLAVEPVVSRSFVYFAVDLRARWDEVKPVRGVCDVNLMEEGIQVGIPTLEHGVYIKTFVRDKALEEYEFLEGYCY